MICNCLCDVIFSFVCLIAMYIVNLLSACDFSAFVIPKESLPRHSNQLRFFFFRFLSLSKEKPKMFWCRPFFSNKQNEKKKIIITIIPTNKQNKKRGKEKRDLYCSYILDVSYFLSLSLCRVAVIIYFVCVYRRLWSN